MKKAIFLDRDGVINKTIFRDGKPRAPYNLDDFELFEGVKEATDKLKEAGYLLIVVTNQPDVARGWVSRENVDLVNRKVLELLQIDEIKCCFHTEKDRCDCRKPRPGMIYEAAYKWNINIKNSYMIGDRYSDIAAGGAAGCQTILVGPGDEQGDHPMPQKKVNSLLEAADWITGQ